MIPLGHWCHPTHQRHKYVYNKTNDTIVESFTNGNLYEYAHRDGVTRYSQVFLFSKSLFSLPKHVVPTTYREKIGDKYFNLLWSIFDRGNELSITIVACSVMGHQENKKEKLNIYERLNVKCDRRSKRFRRKLESGEIHHQPTYFGDAHWCATLGRLRLSYRLTDGLNEHILGQKLVNKMITRQEITRSAIPLVTWKSIEGASKMQSAGDRLWLTKFVSGFAAFATQIKYRHQRRKSESQKEYDEDNSRWKSDLCPICKFERETKFHVLTCTSKRMSRCRKKQNHTLSTW